MKKDSARDLWVILWGIYVAFGLQVLYDGIGEYPNYSQKFWGGLTMEIVSFALLFLYGWKLKKPENSKDRTGAINNGATMKIYVSLRIFWVLLVAGFSAFALLVWFWLIPYYNLEYNLGISLFSSSIFMVLTIVFLNVLLNAREKSEWKSVKDYVDKTIQEELGVAFNEILNYVENGLATKISLLQLHDRKTRNQNGLSELRKLKDAKELKLGAVELASFLEHRNQLDTFLSVSKNLSEVETKYSRFLPPQLALSLMKIRDSMRLIENTVGIYMSLKSLNPALSAPISKEIHEMNEEIPKIISASFKKLIEEIDNIHKMGIEFLPYP
jgi:hypothetical protein